MTKPRISIIGTSNGINRIGYAMALRNRDDVEIGCNASIGSSHSALVPTVMAKIAQAEADICILDLCVNEHKASVAKLYDFEETWRILDYFAERCTAFGMAPLVLLLPRFHPTEGFQTGTTDLWRAACIARELPFLDVLPIAQRLKPEDPGSLWADLNHPVQPLSEEIAATMVAAARLLPTLPQRQVDRPVHDYLLVENLHDHPTERVNTRFQQTFWRIGVNEVVQVPVPPGATLVGLGLNGAQTNCILRIEGDGVLEKELCSMLMTPDRPMWHVVWNLVHKVHSTAGTLLLSARVEPETQSFESNDHRSRILPEHAQLSVAYPPAIELAGLVLRLGPVKRPVVAFDDVAGLADLLTMEQTGQHAAT